MAGDNDVTNAGEIETDVEQVNARRSSVISAPNKARLKFYSIMTFFALYFLYGTFHACRTSWSMMKKDIADKTGYDKWTQGTFDTTFLISYASGLYISGYIGDRIPLKIFLIAGTLIVFSGYMLFALLEGVWKIGFIPLDMLAFVINGLGQSTGWPGCIHILGNWVDKKQRGFIIGLWASNLNIGDIYGQQIGAFAAKHLGWVWGYFIVGATLIGCLVLLVLFVKAKPDDLVEVDPKLKTKGSFQEQKDAYKSALKPNGHRASITERSIGFFEAWMIPGVFRFAIIYLCVKGTVYGCMFWLPSYLKDLGYTDDTTATLLAVFEVGQLIGVAGLGYFTDVLNNRSVIVTCAMGAGSIFFLLTGFIQDNDEQALLMVYLFFAGLCIGGPSGLIAGAVAADLSSSKELKGKVSAMSTITGIIEGSGTVGGALVQLIVPIVGKYSFFFYFGSIFMASALLLPVAIKDYNASKKAIKQDDLMVSLQAKE